MKRLAVVLVVSLLIAGGCAWFAPSIDGEWTQIGQIEMLIGVDPVVFSNLEATFDSGAYSFSYRVKVGEEPSETNTHSGTFTPAAPTRGQTVTFKALQSSGSAVPPVGETFDGDVLYLDRSVLVLAIMFGQDGPVVNWAMERK